jgi:hypothetical protein
VYKPVSAENGRGRTEFSNRSGDGKKIGKAFGSIIRVCRDDKGICTAFGKTGCELSKLF